MPRTVHPFVHRHTIHIQCILPSTDTISTYSASFRPQTQYPHTVHPPVHRHNIHIQFILPSTDTISIHIIFIIISSYNNDPQLDSPGSITQFSLQPHATVSFRFRYTAVSHQPRNSYEYREAFQT